MLISIKVDISETRSGSITKTEQSSRKYFNDLKSFEGIAAFNICVILSTNYYESNSFEMNIFSAVDADFLC
jgi:hypothetical protein